MDQRCELVPEPMDQDSRQRDSRAHRRRIPHACRRTADVLVRRHPTAVRPMRARGGSLVLTMLLVAAPAWGQTADDLFNPDIVHRLDLLGDSRDLEELKGDFLTKDYYPADF